MSTKRRVVVGVGGGIAAYKACHLIRDFTEGGDEVTVVPTESALNFVGAATFEALSGNPVSTTVFDSVDEVQHVKIGHDADLVVIAPATADLIARIAHGRADDLLTATVLTATCPIVLAPAMHTEMWENAATQDNVALLRQRGITVIEPAHGRLTGVDTGAGRLPEPGHIAALARTVASGFGFDHSWQGKKVLVTAGGTQENIDPVRYIGNRSSGRQGFAIADIASQRGAQVTVVAGAVGQQAVPSGAEVVSVRSARDMLDAVTARAADADVFISAAAVADFRPAVEASTKMKKGTDDDALSRIDLVENPDILATVVKMRRDGTVPADTTIVGFAAETGSADADPLTLAKAKLARKGCDLLMCNDVSEGAVFGQTENAGWLLTAVRNAEGEAEAPSTMDVAQGSKHEVAVQILRGVDAFRAAQLSN